MKLLYKTIQRKRVANKPKRTIKLFPEIPQFIKWTKGYSCRISY